MKSLIAAAVLAISVAGISTIAQAADKVPDLKGNWVGKSHAIVAGAGGHWPKNNGSYAKPGIYDKDMVLIIDGQEGRRMWGRTIIGTGADATEEPFIASLDIDNKTLVAADTDGYFIGHLHGRTRASFCYAQAGKDTAAVVSCTELKKAKR